MNKSKKIIGMALSACLCVSMLAGCGSNNKTETSKSNSKTENSETKKTMVMIGAKDRYVAGPKAPACGLTLVGIEYSE